MQQAADKVRKLHVNLLNKQVVNEGRIFASPLAKKLAEEKGIDLRYVRVLVITEELQRPILKVIKPAARPQPAPQPAQKEAAPTAPAASLQDR